MGFVFAWAEEKTNTKKESSSSSSWKLNIKTYENTNVKSRFDNITIIFFKTKYKFQQQTNVIQPRLWGHGQAIVQHRVHSFYGIRLATFSLSDASGIWVFVNDTSYWCDTVLFAWQDLVLGIWICGYCSPNDWQHNTFWTLWTTHLAENVGKIRWVYVGDSDLYKAISQASRPQTNH